MKRSGWPTRLKDLEGRTARTTREITTGMMAIPKGTVITFRSSSTWSKISISGSRCPHCGVLTFAMVRDLAAFDLLPVVTAEEDEPRHNPDAVYIDGH
jgi:hypothetical protein